MTSADALPGEVTFLSIPPDATAIRFWDHWHDRIAVFNTTERSFRAMFPAVTFEGIRKTRSYPVTGFGDPGAPLWKGSAERRQVTDGIIFERIAKNGGGETILYDSQSQTAYYSYGAW